MEKVTKSKCHVSLAVKYMFMKPYAPNRCEPSIEALNFLFIFFWRGDQGRCERRSEVFVKIQFFFFLFFLGGGGSGGRVGGQGRCEQRSEVFVKINKKMGGVRSGGGGRVGRGVWLGGFRMDVNEELTFL